MSSTTLPCRIEDKRIKAWKANYNFLLFPQYVEEINLKYGIALNYTHVEASEIGHLAEMFQVAASSNNHLILQQPQQLPKLQQPQETPTHNIQNSQNKHNSHQPLTWLPHHLQCRHCHLETNR